MSLTAVIDGTHEAVTADRANAAVSFTTTNTLEPGMKAEVSVTVRDHRFTVDEPTTLGGGPTSTTLFA